MQLENFKCLCLVAIAQKMEFWQYFRKNGDFKHAIFFLYLFVINTQ